MAPFRAARPRTARSGACPGRTGPETRAENHLPAATTVRCGPRVAATAQFCQALSNRRPARVPGAGSGSSSDTLRGRRQGAPKGPPQPSAARAGSRQFPLRPSGRPHSLLRPFGGSRCAHRDPPERSHIMLPSGGLQYSHCRRREGTGVHLVPSGGLQYSHCRRREGTGVQLAPWSAGATSANGTLGHRCHSRMAPNTTSWRQQGTRAGPRCPQKLGSHRISQSALKISGRGQERGFGSRTRRCRQKRRIRRPKAARFGPAARRFAARRSRGQKPPPAPS